MSAPTVDVPESPAELTRSPTLGEYFRGYVDRVRGGDIGSLPAVFGLIVLVIVFSLLRPVFFSAGNFANLLTQGAPITVIAMGLVFVLLLGDGRGPWRCLSPSWSACSSGRPWARWWRGSGSRRSWSPWPRSWPSRARCC
jgi:hypothetical protein